MGGRRQACSESEHHGVFLHNVGQRIISHTTTTRPQMPSLTIEQPSPFVARLYNPRPRRATHVEPLDAWRHKTCKATRRQRFVAAAQAKRRWLAASTRIKAVLRFSSPVPHVWGGQKLNAAMRFQRYDWSVPHISNGSFQRFHDLPTTEEGASLPPTPREPSTSEPPAQAIPWMRHWALLKKGTEASEELFYELLTEKGMDTVFQRQHDLAKRRSETWNGMEIFSKLKPPPKLTGARASCSPGERLILRK